MRSPGEGLEVVTSVMVRSLHQAITIGIGLLLFACERSDEAARHDVGADAVSRSIHESSSRAEAAPAPAPATPRASLESYLGRWDGLAGRGVDIVIIP